MNTSLNEVQRENLGQAKCASGQLPVKMRGETWAGRGRGARCALCDGTIGPGEVEYEWRVDSADDPGSLRFHLCCFRSWSLISARLRICSDSFSNRAWQRRTAPELI